jgi:hypothetical protein
MVILGLLFVGVTPRLTFRSATGPSLAHFTGDISGTGVIVKSTDPRSEIGCLRSSQNFDGGQLSLFRAYLQTTVGGKSYLIIVSISPFRGPGTYKPDSTGRTTFQVSMGATDGSVSWTTMSNSSLTIDRGNDHGSIDSEMPREGAPGREHIAGPWTCGSG